MRTTLAIVAFAASAAWIAASGRLAGDFRIDEAHKIAETYFLGALERGDLSPATWLSSRVERSNPPLGRVAFGLAMQAAGVPLPRTLAYDEEFARGRRLPPPELDAQFRRALRPCRTVSLLATALTAALVSLFAFRLGGPWAGALAPLLYMTSFLTQTFAATAVFDALLVLTVVAAGAVLAYGVTWPRTVIAAVLAAAAFDIRVSGMLALAGVLVFLVPRWRHMAAAVAIFVVASTAMNPPYWVGGGNLFERYAMQYRDLWVLVAETREHLLTPLEKVRFVAEYAFGDVAGMVLLVGLAFAAFRRAGVPPAGQAASRRLTLWAAAIVVAFTAWLPIGYPRYVLMTIPPFAIVSAYGWITVLSMFRRRGAAPSRTGAAPMPDPRSPGRET